VIKSRSSVAAPLGCLAPGPGCLPPAALPPKEHLGEERTGVVSGCQGLVLALRFLPVFVCGALGSSVRASMSALRELPARALGSPGARVVLLPYSDPPPRRQPSAPGAVRWAMVNRSSMLVDP